MGHTPNLTRRGLARLALVLAAVLMTYTVLEVGYRVVHYQRVRQRYVSEYSRQGEVVSSAEYTGLSRTLLDSSRFDACTGYRYQPDLDVQLEWAGFPIRWRTNSHGHVSDHDYPKQKPAGEFRIVVLGDSFAAGIMSSKRWPDLLERFLAASDSWTRAVGGRTTRVINVARDGAGIVQFPRLLDCEANAFEPDLVIASFIADDIVRKPYFRGRFAADLARGAEVEDLVRQQVLDQLPFWRPYPELLAATIGPRIGLKRRLEPQTLRYYADDAEGITESIRALTAIRDRYGRSAVFVHHPMVEVLLDREIIDPAYRKTLSLDATQDRYRRLLADFLRAASRLSIVDATSLLPAGTTDEISRWYQYPSGNHPSDEGLAVFADVLGTWLVSEAPRLSGSGQ